MLDKLIKMYVNPSEFIDFVPGIGLFSRYHRITKHIHNNKDMYTNNEISKEEYSNELFWGGLDYIAFGLYHIHSFAAVLEQLNK